MDTHGVSEDLRRMARRPATLVLLALGLTLTTGEMLRAQQEQKSAALPSIKQLADEDQKDRQGAMAMSTAQWKKIGERDAERRREAHKLLDAGTVKTGQDFEDASLIFQHGDTPQDYLLAHVLAMAAMSKGDTAARWIAAATLDRYLQSVKQPQVFGTQYMWKEMKPKPHGATQAPYDKDLVSDALRREFCVATYRSQQKNVAAMAQGKDFPSPDGCPEKR